MKYFYTKVILIGFLTFLGTGSGFGQIISQYVDTDSGTTPKGIEIWNNTSAALDFSTNNLVIERYVNGSSSPTTEVNLTSGTLSAGEVLVIGGSDLSSWMVSNYPSVTFINDSFSFNGDDALEVLYGGTTTDVFGTIGQDPGTSWSGGGVSTADSNIGLLNTINTGTTTGFTDPSTRFEVIESDPSVLTGFGVAPVVAGPENPLTFLASPSSDTQIDLTYEDNADNDFIVIVFDTDNTFTTPSGTVGPVGTSFADGTVLAIVNGSDTFNHTGRVPNTTYYYKAWSVDSSDNYSLGLEVNETTPICSGEPITQATDISFSNTTGSSVDVSWTAGAGGSDYILVIREGNDVSFTPTDGTDYSADTASGDFSAATDQGSGNKIVYSGNGTTASITGLSPSTTYHFQVFYFCSFSNDYLVSDGTNNDGSQTATTTAAAVLPIVQDFDSSTDWGFTASPTSYNDADDVWANVSSVFSIPAGNPGNFWGMRDLDNPIATGDHTLTFNSIDISSYDNVQISFDYYSNGFDSSDDLQYEIYHNGSGIMAGQGIVDLDKNTDAWVTQSENIPDTATEAYIVLKANQNGNVDTAGFDNVTIDGTSFCSGEPSTQASDIVFSNISESSVDVSWTAGTNGSDYILVARESNDVNFVPIDGIDYSGNTASGDYNAATDLGSGNKVVYSGSQTTASVTGLSATTVYHFQVFYFCSSSNDYLTSSGTNNDGTQTVTTAAAPIIIALEDFDGTSPSWPNDISDQTFEDPDTSTEGLFIQTSTNIGSGNTAFGNDLGGESGEPTLSPYTFTFEIVYVENFSNLQLSFDYYASANADTGSYEIFVDGIGLGAVEFYNDPDTTPVQGTIIESIGTASSVSLVLTGTLNGGSDVIELDNFKIEGNYDGDLIYSSGTWSPSPPTTSSNSSDALIQNSTYTTSGNVSLNSISVLGDASVEISSSDVLTIASSINNNGTFTFLSDASGSAQLADASGITINGNVTVERYIPARRAYRLLTTSVNNAGSINANWQEGAVTTVVGNGNPNPGFGTHVTGGSVADGLDQNGSGAPSMFTFDNTFPADQPGETQQDAWSAVSNTFAVNLSAAVPYLSFVRGDRSTNLTINNAPATETTLRATGEIHTGPLSFDLSQEHEFYSLVGNPYQAVVDFNEVNRDDLTDFIYVWDASIGGVNGKGGYVSIELSTGSTQEINPPSPTTSDASRYIAPGMAFFVENLESGSPEITAPFDPSLTFEEDDKATAEAEVTVFEAYPNFYINSRLYISSDLQNGSTERDAVGLRFSENFTSTGSDEDATKLSNPDENYAVINNGLRSIDKQALPNLGHEIDLSITNYTATNYSLTFAMDNKPAYLGVFLKDEYLNTEIELTESFIYDFSVDPNIPESVAEERFSLVFDNTTLSVNDTAFGNNFSLYPNPTSNGQFSIKTPGLSGEVSIEISSLLGQQVYSQKLTVKGQEVNVLAENLSTGVYLVKLTYDDNSFTSKLIVE